MARKAVAAVAPTRSHLLPTGRRAALSGPAGDAGFSVLCGRLPKIGRRDYRYDRSGRFAAGSSQARAFAVEGLRPKALAGAGTAHDASAASHGRTVRRLPTSGRHATLPACCAKRSPRAGHLFLPSINCWTPSESAIASFSLPMAVFAAWGR